VYGALVPYQFSLYNGRYKLFFSLDRNQPLASTTLSFREIYDREDRPFVPGVGSWGDYHSFIEKEFLPYLKDISFLALEGK